MRRCGDMDNAEKFYINGQWVEPSNPGRLDVINPATEEPIGTIAMGGHADVDAAVAAAQEAFESWSQTTVEERLAILNKITEVIGARGEELAGVISSEMGAPMGLAKAAQAATGFAHFATTAGVLANFEFEEKVGTSLIVKEPVGVVGMITPWNWPINQISCKVAPALAAGCTMVLKPFEVARNAAPTVKRVAQELGGKSANIILDDADFAESIGRDAFGMCMNSGQSCNAGTRMLVPKARMAEAAEIAKASMEAVSVGDPTSDGTTIGPVVSEAQWNKIQTLIQTGIDEGATLVTGGTGRPDGVEKGYYVKPTLFSDVTNDMTIAQEEIFGPVLVLIGYSDDDDAMRIANDTPYGLAGYVSGSAERAIEVAKRIRTGNMHVNGAGPDFNAPFGGYKQSGNGREWGSHGLEEFLETKAILGAVAPV